MSGVPERSSGGFGSAHAPTPRAAHARPVPAPHAAPGPRHMCRGLVLLMIVLLVSGASASAAPIVRRGIEATELHGVFRTALDPTAPDGRVIVLAPGALAQRKLDTLSTRAIVVTLAGCAGNSDLTLRIDRSPPVSLIARPNWRGVVVDRHLAAGRHEIRLSAPQAAAHPGVCPGTKVDRLDLVPARSSDEVLLGAAVRSNDLVGDPQYRALFDEYFGSMTPENEMKMEYVEPAEGHYDFDGADTLVDYARAIGKAVRGHVLVEGTQLPGWVRFPLLPWRPASLLGVLRDYITTVMHRYAGSVDTWDVVNEALTPWATYSRNVFERVIGPSYVEDAFRFARAADPTAKLFYNDLFSPGTAHAQAILNMISDFKRRGVPIDGVGIENHTNIESYPSQDQLEGLFASYGRLGIRVEITEMDVSTLQGTGTPAQHEQAQADVYRQAATACWDFANCHRLTTWGIYDGLSWLGTADAPLLFNASYLPKPAFYVVQGALHLHVPFAGS